ncbi:S-adenosyl-L-homocysteine hydrolase [Cnuibacter physcomitrellae]|uniref:Adenosylhomocysteinase n=1 Tax=Cnuibacter physcomitrellae TaxID=1619308 RepID=A0A1X9LLH8_9MICO|nr:adenosylhomocysteinase [Cnuibacter physcomitrellae]ARJ06033.1 adenosylhomocysteinase [Cnuibacter physcomitrellae]GGI37066.1 S-adenosyl-L-homocysteine hydrolase [Cnuibacter physcomitrellae]
MTDLAAQGAARVDWIRSRMALLAAARDELSVTRPFAGRRIGMSLHVEPKTAVLVETLAAGGAELIGTGNHGSTQDDVVAYLNTLPGIEIVGRRDDDLDQHHANLAHVLDSGFDMVLDNGADLVAGLVARGTAATVLGGTEETTSGGLRLRDDGELAGRVPFPVIVINDSMLKAIGENRHAVGQSVVESLMRITNLMVPGRRFVVFGYGWCGRGVAQYLRALGGRVAVVEVDELKAFEAALDGYRVGSIDDFAEWGDVFITATGHPGVLPVEQIERMHDGAVLANCGHFPWEIDVAGLRAAATGSREIIDSVERIDLPSGRHVVLIADGRMFNLAGREPKGNSIESMDLGFLLQTLSLERVATRAAELPAGAQPVPDDIERTIARRFVAALSSAE